MEQSNSSIYCRETGISQGFQTPKGISRPESKGTKAVTSYFLSPGLLFLYLLHCLSFLITFPFPPFKQQNQRASPKKNRYLSVHNHTLKEKLNGLGWFRCKCLEHELWAKAECHVNICRHLHRGGGNGNPSSPQEKEIRGEKLNRYLTNIIKRIKLQFASFFTLGPQNILFAST